MVGMASRTAKPRRRLISVAAVLGMVAASLVAVGAGSASAAEDDCQPFPDVDSSNQHCENIEWLKDQNITVPLDGMYHPENSVTRGAMSAFLFRFVVPNTPSPVCEEKPFPDVPVDSLFCGYIQWAKDSGFAVGYDNGDFGPERAVTRGAMAAFLRRIAEPGTTAPQCAEKPFADVSVDDGFCGPISWMAENEITFGVGDGTNYGTTEPVTRQAMASFLHRLWDFIGSGSEPPVEAGMIEGTVTLTDEGETGAVVTDAQVTAFDEDGTEYSATPTEDGSYAIESVDDGTYTVCFSYLNEEDPAAAVSGYQCYDGVEWDGDTSNVPADADPVTVTDGGTVTGIDGNVTLTTMTP